MNLDKAKDKVRDKAKALVLPLGRFGAELIPTPGVPASGTVTLDPFRPGQGAWKANPGPTPAGLTEFAGGDQLAAFHETRCPRPPAGE